MTPEGSWIYAGELCIFLFQNREIHLNRRTIELAQPDKRTSTIKDVQEVFRAMQHNPIAAYLQDCSFHERLMLASLVKCMKREGVEEIKWGEVGTPKVHQPNLF